MDRAFRILTIYNRLLQNKSVNKQSLILELDTSPRTIQRDIDDIRNFLYESKSWISTPKEITYDYKSESYKLEQDKHENMHFMYDILTALYLTTPKLSHYFYQYLKLLILKHHSDYRTTLLKYLDRFEIDKNQIGISTSSLAIQAMNENKYLQYNQKLLLPLSIYYQMYAFHLVYRMDDEIYIDDISQMNLSLSEKPVDTHEKSKLQTYITFEIAKDVWSKMHRYYQIHVIEKYDAHYLIVTFKVTRLEAIQLCFMHRSNIRIISPPDLREQVIDELLLLQSTYLKQQVQE
ncbi:WYL domain-containing transcriptional factor [Staphylococcus borealis]|uniref:HTH domain-containing protein n=1 Tax=Staphylococcus auricularis TaxID=29379 RepID=A0ABX5IC96_9STAP|nr:MULTISPECIES: HTH domain-containing protein [Staphylococcus]MBM9447955.1 HTH domain-containing protein [Staphylococcus ureilyticus]MCE5039017.1 HTH domain-containing protein [Staphylococcus auricularis]MCE5100185.1 HTH domain-containing protein [Staphylococcus cohnii]MCE5158592.1 HTH domain-containing protein [Staphylococcus epidermidis]MDM7881405.1 HTH domain-containing protein [Staphylococcus borealis]